MSPSFFWDIWSNWALTNDPPSVWLQSLRHEGMHKFPEIEALYGVPQDPAWHPEGCVGVHTEHTVDAMARLCAKKKEADGLSDEKRLLLMFSALCHDFGKPECTEEVDGRIRSYQHPKAGATPTRLFLGRIGAEFKLIEAVVSLVKNHHAHISMGDVPTPRALRRLRKKISPIPFDCLLMLIHADHSGRPPLPEELPQSAEILRYHYSRLQVCEK